MLRICRCELEVCLRHERLVLLWEKNSSIISRLFLFLLLIHPRFTLFTMHRPPPPYIVETTNVSLKLQVINIGFNLFNKIILPICSLFSCSSIMFKLLLLCITPPPPPPPLHNLFFFFFLFFL